MIVLHKDHVGKYNIKGRGLILLIKGEDYQNHIFKVGDELKLDDIVYQVTGIEGKMFLTYPPLLSTELGLLVKEMP